MELEQARKRVEELRVIIERNNRLYYDQDAPELEDFEYDALTRELKALEAEFPQLVTANSPTQKVGGTPSGRFAKVTHAVKMESLLDAFSFDELRDFDRRVREAGIEPEYVVEIKIDGLSCSLEYENGVLVRASTRGDGVVGEDVTANVKAIKRIPKTLKNAPEYLEVRGEVYMPHGAFQHLCAEQELLAEKDALHSALYGVYSRPQRFVPAHERVVLRTLVLYAHAHDGRRHYDGARKPAC